MPLSAVLENGAFVGAAQDGRFSSATRADYVAAAVEALTAPDQAGRTYELAADDAFTMAELAAEVSRQSGREVAFRDLSAKAYKAALTGAGLPDDLAALLADADVAASRGALLDVDGALSRLIGCPAASMKSAVAAALRG